MAAAWLGKIPTTRLRFDSLAALELVWWTRSCANATAGSGRTRGLRSWRWYGDRDQLVQRLDLSKSTVHHHLRLLRTAGLVRVTIGEEHVYSLRVGAIPQAGPLLETYLNEHIQTQE